MRQAWRMLAKGYMPSRWSATGSDITLIESSWTCNGAGSFSCPVEATASVEQVSHESWERLYIFQHRLYVSSLGRIKDKDGNELLQENDEKTKYLQVQIECINKGARVTRPFHVHRLVAYAFCSTDSTNRGMSVHHLNRDRFDNRAANLVFMSWEDHQLLHKTDHDLAQSKELATTKEIIELVASTPARYQLTIKQRSRDWREIEGYGGLYWINQFGLVIRSDNHSMSSYEEPGRRYINLEDADGLVTKHPIDCLVASAWLDKV